ncbi:MAG: nucleotidyltransferase domain-containing protein [Desulfobulbaceae bacterium]|nr:nucleotidyltransferase domain-containing protein [Desulfobulbaceae bacterium]HIJ77758.1 nucleotidyltransferase domain-containing protein [Deltaproteobacteria bacterium]
MAFGLQEEIIKRINLVLAAHSGVDEAVIYGSRAKESHRAGSDIDLTLKGSELNLQTINKISRELDDLLLPYSFDLSIYNQIENQDLLDHIKRVGKVFYRKTSPTR